MVHSIKPTVNSKTIEFSLLKWFVWKSRQIQWTTVILPMMTNWYAKIKKSDVMQRRRSDHAKMSSLILILICLRHHFDSMIVVQMLNYQLLDFLQLFRYVELYSLVLPLLMLLALVFLDLKRVSMSISTYRDHHMMSAFFFLKNPS